MFQFPFTAGQSAANLAQCVRSPQLAKQHRHELSPTRETLRATLGLMFLNGLFEFQSRE